MNPFLTIVIPTRNRAAVLRTSLASALWQAGDDVEVLVVDNHSSDDTPAVVAAAEDGRVRYHRVDTALSQPDNWNGAVRLARGEWVMVLSDDDGMVPSFVERVRPVLEGAACDVVSFATPVYNHPSSADRQRRNHLTVLPWSGRTHERDARRDLASLYQEVGGPRPVPKMGANCLARRSLLQEVDRRAGRVFFPPFSDIGLAAALLGLSDHYLTVDQPLLVRGIADTSIGVALLRGAAAGEAFVAEFGGEPVTLHVPIRATLPSNLLAESLLTARAALPDVLGHLELGWPYYFFRCRRDIERAAAHVDVSPLWQEWRRALRSQPAAVRAQAWRVLAAERATDAARRLRRRVPLTPVVRRYVRTTFGGGGDFAYLEGARAGFDDLRVALQHIETAVLSPPGRAAAGAAEPGAGCAA